jgi:Holliday junction DNA helicase RuvA
MIALLTGKIISKSPGELIVDVSGVGYRLSTTLNSYEQLPDLDEVITLHVYTHVREDSLSLFGFFSKEEKEIFIRLLKVNGIGPKLGLSILSGVGPADFVTAVTGEDLARLNAIPGVGRKTAERIILDLKDKLTGTAFSAMTTASASATSGVYDDAISALTNLGYNKQQAEKALGKVGLDNERPLTIIIKDALKEMVKR